MSSVQEDHPSRSRVRQCDRPRESLRLDNIVVLRVNEDDAPLFQLCIKEAERRSDRALLFSPAGLPIHS